MSNIEENILRQIISFFKHKPINSRTIAEFSRRHHISPSNTSYYISLAQKRNLLIEKSKRYTYRSIKAKEDSEEFLAADKRTYPTIEQIAEAIEKAENDLEDDEYER